MRKLIPLLFLFFAVNGIAAYFPLQETFFLDDLKSLTLEETASTQPTPSSGKTKLYVKNGELTILDDTGTETAVGTVSDHNDTTNIQGGTTNEYYHLTNTQHNEVTTEVNPVYIKNGGAEQALSGWSCSANVTITRNTTTPLKGTGDFDLDVTSSAVAGNYCQYAFTATNADMETKMLTASIDAIKYISAYNNGDIRVCVYDVTAAKCLRTDYFFDTSPKFSADFQIETNSSLALRFEVVTPSVARELRLEGISVKPQAPSVSGAVVTEWESYTPTINNGGTTSSINFKYRQVGDSVEISGTAIFSGSGTASILSFTLPSGLTADTNKIGGTTGGGVVVGPATLYDSSATDELTASTVLTSATLISIVQDGNTNASPMLGNFLASGDYVRLKATVPILGWSSNMKLSSQESGREIVVRATRESATQTLAVGDTEIIFDTKDQDKTNSYSTSTGRFTATEEGYYLTKASLSVANGATAPSNARYNFFVDANTSGVRYGAKYFASGTGSGSLVANEAYGVELIDVIWLNKGQTISVWSNQTGQPATLQNAFGQAIFTVTKLNTGSSTIAKDAFVFEKYDTSSSLVSASTSSGVAVFTNKVRSTHGAYNTSTGKFKAPRDGVFEVCVLGRNDTTMTAANGAFLLTGGDGVSTADYNKAISPYINTTTLKSGGCQTFSASINEEAWIVPYHPNATGTQALNGSAQQNWVTWRSLD